MKRKTLTLLIILCLFTLALENYKISVKASPTTWIVDTLPGQGNFTSIQEAINTATTGDTIFVRNGTYYENLVVNKSLTLVGENRDYTIINGSKSGNVVLVNADNVTIKCFTIIMGWGTYYGSGIRVESVSSTVICDNNISDNLRGISFYYSNGNNVFNNLIRSCYFEGIYLHTSSGNVISNNTISFSKYGITFDSSNENIISNNLIFSNELSGTIAFYSENNVICGNVIDKNSNGISLISPSVNNTVYHNNFYDNKQQVFSDSENVWNYNEEGNYWSNYTGHDLTGDGIGDSPYIIDENNRDYFPLMGPFYEFNVLSTGKQYPITVISNNTISDFNFEVGCETGNKIIRFNVNSVEGSFGFCRMTVPVELMAYPYIVLVNGASMSPVYLNASESYVRMYLAYPLEGAQVLIISSEMLRLYFELLAEHYSLNQSYDILLNDYSALLGNYSLLQESLNYLNTSYQQLLSICSMQEQIIQNFMYVAAFSAVVFIMVTVYLSKHAHARSSPNVRTVEEEE